MGYKSFEELPVWNSAVDLAVRTFAMTSTGGVGAYSGLKNQIERAVVSISNNIAEGFERGTHDELVAFLYYALGSAGEVRSMLLLIQRLPNTEGLLQPHVDALIPMTRSVSRQLSAWIESLKDGGHRGPRHQNHATRTARQYEQRGKAFLETLEQIKAQAKRPREEDRPES